MRVLALRLPDYARFPESVRLVLFMIDFVVLLQYFVQMSPRKPKDNTTPIFNRLTVLRAERGLSRQALADAVGVNYQTIGYLERRDYSPSLDLAMRLSEYFELPIEAIFSRLPFEPLSAEVYKHASGKQIDE